MNVPKNLQLLHKHTTPGQVFLDLDEVNNEALFATYTGVSYINPTKIKLEAVLPARYVMRVRHAAKIRARFLGLSEPSTIIDIHAQLNTPENEHFGWTALQYVTMRMKNDQ